MFANRFVSLRPRLATTLLSMALVACGGGSDGDSSATGTSGGSGDALVGTWTTNVSQIMADNPAIFSSINATCNGPVVLTFRSNGSFEQNLEAGCSFPEGRSGSATIRASGNWTATATQITVTNAVNSGVITVDGVSRPLTFIGNGTANYSISGNRLTLQPAVSGGTVQNYTRS